MQISDALLDIVFNTNAFISERRIMIDSIKSKQRRGNPLRCFFNPLTITLI